VVGSLARGQMHGMGWGRCRRGASGARRTLVGPAPITSILSGAPRRTRSPLLFGLCSGEQARERETRAAPYCEEPAMAQALQMVTERRALLADLVLVVR
jgi:hypothetical protein